MTTVSSLRDQAQQLDLADPLAPWRSEFAIPCGRDGQPVVYLAGNSLGLQPRRTASYLSAELDQWAQRAIDAHFAGKFPWMPYHEFLASPMASLVGATDDEVVMMNSLTVNLHLMLATFYQPRGERFKILIEHGAFPSDRYAVQSHVRWRGRDPRDAVLAFRPRADERLIDEDRLCQTIRELGETLAVVLLPAVQYYTGQALDLKRITRAAHEVGAMAGWDLAHAAGNLALELDDAEADFAVWCTYKYLNSGPGSVGGCFVSSRHAHNTALPRLGGWWGHDKATRFQMPEDFAPIATAEGWQLSNPPILSLAAIRAALDVFVEAGGMQPLRHKSQRLTAWAEQLIDEHIGPAVHIVTPRDPARRGCQLSLEIRAPGRSARDVQQQLGAAGVMVDWREPNVIRVAPAPLYNSFEDVRKFVAALAEVLR